MEFSPITVAVATITNIPSGNEELFSRTRRAITEFAQQGIVVFVTDGGSDKEYAGKISCIPGVCVQSLARPNLARRITHSITRAAQLPDIRWVLFCPSDWDEFAAGPYLRNMVSCISLETTMVIASRKIVGGTWPGYPESQVKIEMPVNYALDTLLGQSTNGHACLKHANDYQYGPILMRKDVAQLSGALPPAFTGREAVWYSLGIASRLGTIEYYIDEMPFPPQPETDPSQITIKCAERAIASLQGVLAGIEADKVW